MARATTTITDAGMVMIPVWEYEGLVRESERLAIVTDYLTNEKYSTVRTVEMMLGIEKEKAGEE